MAEATSNVISVDNRLTKGKGAARAVRRAGQVPSVIYGGDKPPISVALDPRVVAKGLESGHFFSTVYNVEVGENKEQEKAIVRDVQFDPVTDRPLHVDFMRVTANTKVTLSIPVVFKGEEVCPGLKEGGLLSIVRHEVQVICRAADIPDEFVCDISTAVIGDTLKISSISLPDGVQPTITDRDFVIANLLAPKLIEEIEETTDEELEEGEEGAEGAEGEAADGDKGDKAAKGDDKGDKGDDKGDKGGGGDAGGGDKKDGE